MRHSRKGESKMARPLTEALQYLKTEYVQTLRNQRQNYRERLKQAEQNYLAAQLLAVAGYEVVPAYWCPHYMELELESGKELAKVREALGCRLKATGQKSPVKKSRNRVWVSVEAEGFPGLTIRYKTKLSPHAKCKVVTRKSTSSYRTLVCEA
jgi:hypothetical protein